MKTKSEFIIPQDVYDAINNPYEGFDKMYYRFLSESSTNERAFEKAVDRMQEYFPQWNRYTSWVSYYTARNRRIRKCLKR